MVQSIAAATAHKIDPVPILEGPGGEISLYLYVITLIYLESGIMDDMELFLRILRRDLKRGGVEQRMRGGGHDKGDNDGVGN